MTDQIPSTANPSTPAKRKPGNLLLGFVWWVGIAMLAIGIVSSFWTDSVLGPAVPILIRQSATILAVMCGVVWFVFGSKFIKGIVAQLALLALIALLPFLLIKDIEFTGDMELIIYWRWSKSQEDRLEEYARSNVPGQRDVEGAVPVIGPHDMPSFNGPAYDGRAPGPALLGSWETQAPVKLWERPVGAGYAGVAIVEEFIVTLEQRYLEEFVTCYDLRTGDELWNHSYPALFSEEAGGHGPRSTPLVSEDRKVFTTGAVGDVCCLDLADGSLNWQVNVLQKDGQPLLPYTTWGLASSPLLWHDLLIINVGGPEGKGLVALDRASGDFVWQGAGVPQEAVTVENRAGYSTPFVATIDGVEFIIHLDGEGLRGYLPETGEILWSYAFRNQPGVNVAQPIVFPDGRVFITCAYSIGCRMLKVSRVDELWQVSDVWGNTRMRCKFCSPIYIDGFIYGLDEGVLSCFDAETGERKWRDGRYGHGQMLLRDDLLVIFTEDGEIALVRPSPDEFHELALLPVFDRDKNWNPPGLAEDILVVRNHYDMAAFKLPLR